MRPSYTPDKPIFTKEEENKMEINLKNKVNKVLVQKFQNPKDAELGADDGQEDERKNNQKEVMSRLKTHWKSKSTELLLESEKLYMITFLEEVMDKKKEEITEANLKRNYVSNIDVMAKFPNLMIIDASDNYISSINFALPKLTKLILRNNFLEKIPTLFRFPALQELDLSTNKLTSFRLQIVEENFLNLTKINLNNNKIDFCIGKAELAEFIEKLKKMKMLSALNIDNNKFDQSIIDTLVHQLDKLTNLNGRDKSYYKSSINKHISMSKKEEDNFEEPANNQSKFGKGMETEDQTPDKHQKKGKNFIPSLENLCYNLDQAICHPTFELIYLKNLFSDAEMIAQISDTDKLDENFSRNLDEVKCKNMIETFMQNAMLLVDNHFELRKIMLSILCKLTIIKTHDFGRFCFATLKDLMVAGQDLEELVMEKIKDEVIDKLEHNSGLATKVPMSLLMGLQDLVIQSKKPKILESLFKNYFEKNLRDLREQIFMKRKIKMVFGNHAYFDAIIGLLTASVQESEDNVKQLLNKKLQFHISDIFQETNPNHDRYLNLLTIIKEICRKDSTEETSAHPSNFFIQKYVHRTILQEVKVTYYNYKKNNDLTGLAHQKETTAQKNVRYKIFAGQIDCLANLLNAEESEREKILKGTTNLVYDLINIVGHFKTDPKILTAVCNLTLAILQKPEIVSNIEYLSVCIQKIANCVPLIGYLGKSKYEELVKNSRKYHQTGSDAQEKEYQLTLQYMDDPIVHELFISIIKLISFFSEKLQELEQKKNNENDDHKEIYNLIKLVTVKLNEAEREDALFKVLDVPRDEVRLEVVKCLFTVPLTEFDQNEISQLIELMQTQNIGAGNTEIIFSFIFWILTKMVMEDDSISAAQIFKIKFSQIAVNQGLSILKRNSLRKIDDDDEEKEKYTLNLSILNFIKHASFCPKSKQHLQGKEKILAEVLVSEQNCGGSLIKTPIDIENTQLASKYDLLKEVISGNGNDNLEPYNYVSFRVLVRIANLLQGIQETLPQSDYKRPYQEIIEGFFEDQKQKLKQMIKKERSVWDENSSKSSMQKTNEHLQEHESFAQSNGPEILRMFLFKANQDGQNWIQNNQDPDIEKIVVNKTSLLKNLEKQLKKSKTDKSAEEQNSGQANKRMREEFKNQDLGHGYHTHVGGEKHAVQVEAIKINYLSKKQEFGIQNDKLRCLCVAAFLRCLHAALDYSGAQDIQKKFIHGLTDLSVFRSITQLCHTTNWFKANIGTKYLIVFIYVLKLDFSKGEENTDNLKKYQIFSIVIQKILRQLRSMIDRENENQKLSSDDKVLISKVAQVSFEMCYQCSLFPTIEATARLGEAAIIKCPMANHVASLAQQKQLLELLVSHLFPLNFTKILVEVIVQDMEATAVLSQASVEQVANEEHRSNPKFDKLIQTRTREFIKRFIAEYMAYCKDNKYQIIEYIMKKMIFQNQSLRQSFIDEMLCTSSQASLRHYYITYIQSGVTHSSSSLQSMANFFKKQIHIEPQEQQHLKLNNRLINAIKQNKTQSAKERVILSTTVYTSQNVATGYTHNILFATNIGIYFLKDSVKDPCKNCNQGDNCFGEPEIRALFLYSHIKSITVFEQFRQMILISYDSTSQWMEKGQSGGFFGKTPDLNPLGESKKQNVWIIIHKKTDGEMFRHILRYFKPEMQHVEDPFLNLSLRESVHCETKDSERHELKFIEYCYDHKDMTTIQSEKHRTQVVVAITDEHVLCCKVDRTQLMFPDQFKNSESVFKQYQEMIKVHHHKTSGGTAGATRKPPQNSNDPIAKALQQCVKTIWTLKVEELKSLTMELDKVPAVTLSTDDENHCLSFLSDLARMEFVETLVGIINEGEDSEDQEDH